MRRATRGQVFLPGRALAARFDVAVPVVLSVASRHVFALSADCCTPRLTMFLKEPQCMNTNTGGGCALRRTHPPASGPSVRSY